MKKYNFEDNFEMVYLRHDYIERCDNLNGEFVGEYKRVVEKTSNIMYFKFKSQFDKVGFDIEDIKSITNMYLVSYMNLYSLRFNEELKDRFINKFKIQNSGNIPTETAIYTADKNNMVNFLRQRLMHCARVCGRKARNIVAANNKVYYFAHTKYSIPACNELIIENYKKYGYRKATKKEYYEGLKKAINLGEGEPTDSRGFKIMKIELNNDRNMVYGQMIHFTPNFKTPEYYLDDGENMAELERFKNKFVNMDTKKQRSILSRFVKNNKHNRSLSKEVALARKLLIKKDFLNKTIDNFKAF